jgi:hypothetical protein
VDLPIPAGVQEGNSGEYAESPGYIPSPESIQVMTDFNGKIRLVTLILGRGRITIMGMPYFMRSRRLGEPQNALLAWNLLKEDARNTEDAAVDETAGSRGVLFIRGEKQEESLFGKIFERGDFTCLIISGLALIGIGLWMVLPMFGFFKQDDEKPLKPIRERFLAEANFLKKYRALDTYRGAYIWEIRRRVFRNKGIVQDEYLAQCIIDICGKGSNASVNALSFTIEEVASALAMNKKFSGKEFLRDVVTLKTILECL